MQPDHQPSDGGDGADEAEERAWRAIVDNYGDRAEIDEPPTAPPPANPTASSAPFGGRFGDPSAFAAESDDEPFVADEEEGFTPPEPPPLPRVEPDRLLAWAGVLGSPAVLLCALLFSIGMPVWLGYLLVAAFVGGFLYLVVKMPREPRDPWDDGAQV